jgi:transposase
MLTQEVVIMGRPRRAFTREFKREAVKLVTEGGHPTAQVARDLDLTPNLLRRWTQEVAGDPVAAFPGKGRRKPHEEERARLKRVELPDVANRQRVATKEELLSIKQESDKRRLKKIEKHEYDPLEFWRIVTVALNTGLREAKILEIDRTWIRKRDDGCWLILPPARSRLKQTPREIPLNPAAYEALRSDLVHVDGRNLQAMECGRLLYVLATTEQRGESDRSPLP